MGQDQTENIGRDQRLDVTGHRRKTVHGDEQIKVDRARTTTVTGKDTTTIESDRDTSVSGNVKDAFLANRTYSLTGSETVEIGEDRKEQVRGTCELTADVEYKLKQGVTTLHFHEDGVDLDAGKAITLKRGSGTVVIADDGAITIKSGERVTLECGQSKITIGSDKIVLQSATVEAQGQQGALKLDPAGAALSGMQCKVDGSAGTSVTGATVTLN